MIHHLSFDNVCVRSLILKPKQIRRVRIGINRNEVIKGMAIIYKEGRTGTCAGQQ